MPIDRSFPSWVSVLLNGLVAISVIGCGGSSESPKADQGPLPILTATGTITYTNLDNPGSTSYISGDRVEYTVLGNTIISNYINPNAGIINTVSLYPYGNSTVKIWTGNNTNTFTSKATYSAPIITSPSNILTSIKINALNPITSNNQEFTINSNYSVTPATSFTYFKSDITVNFNANYANILATSLHFNEGSVNGTPLESFYMSYLYSHAISFTLDFARNSLTLQLDGNIHNSSSFFVGYTSNRSYLYSLQSSYTKPF